MNNYEEARVKLANTQLSKLKSATKIKTRTTLIITMKNNQDKKLSRESFLTYQT